MVNVQLLLQPVVGLVNEYVIVCVPTPAAEGLNMPPLTPGPL